jgi:hypothetical protein
MLMQDDTMMAPGAEPEEEQASEEEQAQLEQAYGLAQELLYGEGEAGDQVAQLVQQADDIAEGIARAAATTVVAVEKRTGGLSEDVLTELTALVVADLVELAVEYGAISEDGVTDEFVESIAGMAFAEYGNIHQQMGDMGQQQPEPQPEQMQPQPQPQQGGGLLGI